MKIHDDEYTYVKDLFWYDGPLLSLYEKDSQKYLIAWWDVNDNVDTWLLYDVTDENLQKYYDNKITLRYLMQFATNITQFNYTDINGCYNIITLKFNDIPDDQLPSTDSYYDL